MYVDLNLKFSSAKKAKAMVAKALNVGFSIVAVSVQYEEDNKAIPSEPFKIVNCFVGSENGKEKTNGKSCSGNYFVDRLDKEEELREQLVQMSSNQEGNYILVNRPNSLSVKNVCADFIMRGNCPLPTREELNGLRDRLMGASSGGSSSGSTAANTRRGVSLANNTNTHVLRRVNIKYQDAVMMEHYSTFVKNSNFDIVAIEVSSADEINSVAMKLDCDIIFFNMSHTFAVLKKSDVQSALDRGIFFEISSLAAPSEEAHYYHAAINICSLFSIVPFGRIIVSSGALTDMQVVEPLNLLRLFFNFHKISYKDLIGCLTTTPIACVQRASVRKSLNTAVFQR
ncbi:ribonuclease P/MRP protein subunit RPP1, putative [Plasmodium vivax]|uniref:Ribonuclease P/MRP protein subunit RPP1, putative n=1 Tax=Plasmodium vivax TaxID=5855 RepID=A0A564ZXC0_PLAVI|nr:ribonuclease P/MRP protein subunit RPP1, putative [Plasmodium vivax]